MRHEITMPQLGMTQDSGVIVSWGKRLGDAVRTDDILMEVETDKSTMEVEVGHDGFLAEVRADAGAAVPVGDVVAVISDSADDIVDEPVTKTPEEPASAQPESKAAEEVPVPTPKPEPAAKAERRADARAPSKTPAAGGDGRIFASPKAKMEAHRRGVDLARLAGQGVPQPFHVADLEKLASQPHAGGGSLSALAATVERAAFDGFREWIAGETDGRTGSASIWAAFASAAWRAVNAPMEDEPLVVRVETLVPIPSATVFCDADCGGLGEIVPVEGTDDANLVVLDLTGSGLAEYRSGGSACLTFTVTEVGGELRITLGFDEARLSVARAAAVLAGLAGRVRDPLRHLL